MKGPGAAVQVDEGAGRVRAKGDRGVRDAEERGDREGRPWVRRRGRLRLVTPAQEDAGAAKRGTGEEGSAAERGNS